MKVDYAVVCGETTVDLDYAVKLDYAVICAVVSTSYSQLMILISNFFRMKKLRIKTMHVCLS